MAKVVRSRKASFIDDNGDGSPPVFSAPAFFPTSLDQIIGHDRAKRIVRESITSGRVHHAWIFGGPQGVGKFAAAYAFAAELLAGSEEANRRLASGQHPDLHIIRKELALASDDEVARRGKQTSIAKAVIEQFVFAVAPLAAKMPGKLMDKVFIIDEAELLDRSPTSAPTQNALLKLLEEPPRGTAFILVTTDENRLLQTIRSRCQRVGFGPLKREEVVAVLQRVGISLPTKPDLDWAIAFAENSPGATLQTIALNLFQWRSELLPLLCDVDASPHKANTLGSVMFRLVEAQAAHQAGESKTSSKDAANRYWTRRMLAAVAGHYRDLMLKNPGRATAAMELCSAAERQMDANVQLALIFENLAAQLCWAGRVAEAKLPNG